MNIKKIKNELKNRSIWKELTYNAVLHALLVKTDVKRNSTIGRLRRSEADLGMLKQFFDFLDLEYIFTEKTGMLKAIIGTDRKEVEEIYDLEEDVFVERGDSMKDFRYGILMGYPECCCEKMTKPRSLGHIKNYMGYHYHRNNPWPWQLSCIEPLVYHFPCSSDCEESIEMGREVSRYREEVLPDDHRLTPPENVHPSYVLSFADNLYICFKKEKKEGENQIKEIFRKQISPHDEHTQLSQNLKEESLFVKEIKERDFLIFKGSKIILREGGPGQAPGKVKEVYKKEDKSRGVLIRFVI